MFHSLSLPLLLLVFAVAAGVVWLAGIQLSNTTDILAERSHMGEALGGLILLAITTNLPEIAIVGSAAVHHNMGIAIGNILGGIGIQTVVLVILDACLREKRALTYMAASLTLVLEGVLVVAVLVVAIMGTQFPKNLIFARMTPEGLLIAAIWLVGLYLISKARTDLPWQNKGDAPGGQEADQTTEARKKQDENEKKTSTGKAVAIFGAASVATLVAGVVLELTGEGIAKGIHMEGVLFGATVLAAATSLPEVSTGLASVKIGDYQLAISDIFGGNAFLPVLFLFATLLSGQAVLPQAQKTDIYLAGLGILLTTVYVTGLVFRPDRQFLRLGADSFAVLILYALGLGGLFMIAR